MEDQYFAYLSRRSLDCIHDFEVAMWKLGVPIQVGLPLRAALLCCSDCALCCS